MPCPCRPWQEMQARAKISSPFSRLAEFGRLDVPDVSARYAGTSCVDPWPRGQRFLMPSAKVAESQRGRAAHRFGGANGGMGVPPRPSVITRSSSESGMICTKSHISQRRGGAQIAVGSVATPATRLIQRVEVEHLVGIRRLVAGRRPTWKVAADEAQHAQREQPWPEQRR